MRLGYEYGLYGSFCLVAGTHEQRIWIAPDARLLEVIFSFRETGFQTCRPSAPCLVESQKRRFVESQKRQTRLGRVSAAVWLMLAASGVLAGCANPGVPRPPSLHLPATVTDLTGERVGDRVELHWTPPKRTTDGLELTPTTFMTAEICRDPAGQASASKTLNGKTAAVACTTVVRVPNQQGGATAPVTATTVMSTSA